MSTPYSATSLYAAELVESGQLFSEASTTLATPNYGYEKRQKELAKRRKKEDKLKAKADRKLYGPGEGEAPADDAPADQAGNAPPPPTGS